MRKMTGRFISETHTRPLLTECKSTDWVSKEILARIIKTNS